MPQVGARRRTFVVSTAAGCLACLDRSTGGPDAIRKQRSPGTSKAPRTGAGRALLDELKAIPANAFEAVDTAPMEVHHNSGEAH